MMNVLTNSFSSKGLSLPARMEIDWVLLGLVITVASIGLLMVASSSMSLSESYFQNPWHMVIKQSVFLMIGVVAAGCIAMVPVTVWQQYGWVLLILTFAVLLLVLVPGIGRRVNGSQRWLLVGPITIQASELVKLFMVLFFANYLSRRHEELKTSWKGVLKPLVIVCVVAILLLLEPDFGGSVVIAGTIFAMMFIAGMKLWQFLSLLTAGVGVMGLVAVLSPYRMQRLITFLDPWADQFNSGYQLTQSLIAFGQGQWFGVGLGRSVQKLFYLPDAHTDFIFSIFAEEFGLIGAVILIGLFAAIVFRILKLARYLGASKTLSSALRASRTKIVVFLLSVVILTIILGTIMYLVEGPKNGFTSIPYSMYWAIVTLTTVGYGDISPQSPLGQFIASMVMILGYGIIAVPTGIVTSEITKIDHLPHTNTQHCPHCSSDKHLDNSKYCRNCGEKLNL